MSGSLERVKRVFGDRYVIARQLGSGGMATVYLAHDPRHDRPVAVKVLNPELAAAVGIDRFLKEIRLTANLQHAHIVPLFDSGHVGPFVFYVMPYVEGDTVRHRLVNEGQLSIGDAVAIVNDVADALDYAHSCGVVHRDIKPENILLSPGHALVADFGIARAVSEAGGERLTASGISIGTPEYMSPEQATGDAILDGRSDIYSLGCVLYEMLAGEPPFTGTSGQAVIARHITESPPSLKVVRSGVSREMEQAVQAALAKSPADRFRTAGDLARAVSGSVEVAPTAKPRSRRSKLPLLVAAAVTALIALIVGMPSQREANVTPRLSAGDPSRVAVLYFADNSEGESQDHIAHGLTEALAAELARVDALRVVSGLGVRPYRHADIPIDSVARLLDVGTIVEGTISLDRETIRVMVRVVNGETGESIDVLTLERPFGELFLLQDQLVDEVSQFLRETLGEQIRLRQRRAATRNVDAWERFQRAELWRQDARDAALRGDVALAYDLLIQADSLYGRAAELDPLWIAPIVSRGWMARQFELLTEAIMRRRARGDRLNELRLRTSAQDWREQTMLYAERALQIDVDAPEALELRGAARYRMAMNTEGDRADMLRRVAEADLRAAVSADASRARAWHLLSRVLQERGDFPQAYVAAENAMRADAYLEEAEEVLNHLLSASLNLERFQEAGSWCALATKRFPNDPRFLGCELTVLGWAGREREDIERAWRLLAEIDRKDSLGATMSARPHQRMMVAAVIARSGLADSARAVIEQTRASVQDDALLHAMLYDEAYVRVLLGEPDTAVNLLESFLASSPQWRQYVASSPWFRGLHRHERFQTVVAQ